MDIFDIARDVVLEAMAQGEPFTQGELKRDILMRDGVMRVAPNMTVTDYLKEFIENGTLIYDGTYYRIGEGEK